MKKVISIVLMFIIGFYSFSQEEYSFSDNHRIKKMVCYWDNMLSYEVFIEYGPNDRVSEIIYFYDGDYEFKTVYFYTDDGFISLKENYEDGEKLSNFTEYEYGFTKMGEVITEKEYYEGMLYSENTYYYDYDGNLISTDVYYEEELAEKIEYKYKDGNLVLKELDSYDYVESTEYVYNNNGTLKKIIFPESAYGKMIETFAYESGRLIGKTLDSDMGSSELSVEYDKNGNPVKIDKTMFSEYYELEWETGEPDVDNQIILLEEAFYLDIEGGM